MSDGTKSILGNFLINKIRKAKLIGIYKATKFPFREPASKEPPIITVIPVIAKKIENNVFKLIFSFKNKNPNIASHIV